MSNQRYHDLARAIAEAMGEEWQYQPDAKADPRFIMPCANILGPGGCGIHLAHEYQKDDRVAITGTWPAPLDNPAGGEWTFLPYSRPSITCAMSRPPAAIARDIANRLLPEYLPMWREQVAKRNQMAIQFALVRMAYDELQALVPGSNFIPHNGRLDIGGLTSHGYTGTVELSYSGDNDQVQGKIDLGWVPWEKVVRIVQVLAS